MDPFFDSINEGCFIASYQGHGTEHHITESVAYNIYQHHNHLNNVNKCPFSTYFACATAWFDKAGDDCIVEDLIRYSNNKGYVGILACPRIASFPIHTYITDPPTGFQELIWYSIFKNNNFIVGEFIEEAKLLQPWGGDPRDSQRFRFQLFGDPALNIMATGYEITKPIGILPCNNEISNKIFIRNGGQASLGNCDYFLRDQGQIIVDEGGTLLFNNLTHVFGENYTNLIQINGNATIPTSPSCELTFTSLGSDHWKGLVLNNSNANLTLKNVTFINCNLTSKISELYINHCTFTNSSIENSSGFCSITNGSSFTNGGVSHTIGTLSITENSTFNPGSVNARNAGDHTKLVWIQNCNFIGAAGLGSPPILIEHYHNFYINNCDILSPQGCSGITIINSGELGTRYNDISNCDITCRMDDYCYSETGIVLYNSRANIKNNYIHNNCYGLKIINRSASTIQGTILFQSEEATQRIKDNYLAQFYITQDAFPSYLRWNTIYDSYFQTSFIYYTDPRPPILNVENNYWGRNHDPYSNLYPYGYYDYIPIYSPPLKDEDIIETIYNEAIINADSGFYQAADSLFKYIIDQYPESKYALLSVKDLFWLNKSWNNDYVSLKTYLNTIELDSNLVDIVGFISNRCNIEMGNYENAINWYDSIIQNPVSMEDSVFALIDLMDLSLIIDHDSIFQKSSNLQINSAYKPKDYIDYTTKRKVLIDLLGTQNDSQNPELPPLSDSLSSNSKYIECFPNPFSNTAEVHFNVNYPSFIKIDLYDTYGRVVFKITDKFYTVGKYVITLNMGGVSKGIYIIRMNINDHIKGTKKIVIE